MEGQSTKRASLQAHTPKLHMRFPFVVNDEMQKLHRICICSCSSCRRRLSKFFLLRATILHSTPYHTMPHDFVQLPVRLSQSISSNPHTSNRPPSLPLSAPRTRFVGLSYPYIWYSAPIQRLEWIDGYLSIFSLSSWAACPLYCHSVTLPGQARLLASQATSQPGNQTSDRSQALGSSWQFTGCPTCQPARVRSALSWPVVPPSLACLGP